MRNREHRERLWIILFVVFSCSDSREDIAEGLAETSAAAIDQRNDGEARSVLAASGELVGTVTRTRAFMRLELGDRDPLVLEPYPRVLVTPDGNTIVAFGIPESRSVELGGSLVVYRDGKRVDSQTIEGLIGIESVVTVSDSGFVGALVHDPESRLRWRLFSMPPQMSRQEVVALPRGLIPRDLVFCDDGWIFRGRGALAGTDGAIYRVENGEARRLLGVPNCFKLVGFERKALALSPNKLTLLDARTGVADWTRDEEIRLVSSYSWSFSKESDALALLTTRSSREGYKASVKIFNLSQGSIVDEIPVEIGNLSSEFPRLYDEDGNFRLLTVSTDMTIEMPR